MTTTFSTTLFTCYLDSRLRGNDRVVRGDTEQQMLYDLLY